MNWFEDLMNKATGLKAGLLDQANNTMTRESLSGGGRSYNPNTLSVSQDDYYKKEAERYQKAGSQISNNVNQASESNNRGYQLKPKIATDISTNGIVPPKKPDAINELAKNPSLFKNIFGMSADKMSKNWEEKGGFDGLMANPGFLLGMSILQSSAQGQTIGSGVFDAAVKAGTISAAYADKIKSKQGLLAPVTEEQRDLMKGVAEEQGITAPGILDKMKNLFGGNAEAMYREALDDIYVEAERLAQGESKRLGKKIRLDPRKFGKQAMKNLQASGKLVIRKDRMYRSGTLQAKTSEIEGNRAKGGPIKAGKNYVVGEEGPEMFVAETNGTIINNDDSKVVSMLLESNPQLKNVSRARAVKILKARFPDYF
jgi:hypothetical protein